MDRPNVVLIVLDTARKDHFSWYGHDRETTPSIDDFASSATTYTNAHAPSIWSLPTHASMFTGKYPHEHGATFVSPYLGDEPRTLAERLSEDGYTTIGVSPNFVVRPAAGLHRGFDEFSTPEVMNVPEAAVPLYRRIIDIISGSVSLHQVSERIFSLYRRYVQIDDPTQTERSRSPQTVSRVRARLNDVDDPFFLFINLLDPHLPHCPEERFKVGFVDEDAPELPERQEAYTPSEAGLTDDQLEALKDLYDADLRAMDHHVGQILDELKDRDLFEDSLIILVADHGENLGENGMLGHQFSVADPLIEVPLLIKYPGQQEPTEIEEPVTTRTLYHTILDETIAEMGETLKEPDDSPVLGEYVSPMVDVEALMDGEFQYDRSYADNPIRFVTDGTAKLVVRDGSYELNAPDRTEPDTTDIRTALTKALPEEDMVNTDGND